MAMFDLIVLGGGPAGYLAAERAANGGLKTAVIEKRALGGVCLNEGCIPSKALLNSAKIYEHAKEGSKYGISASDVKLDQKAVVARRGKVVKTLVSGVGAKMKGAGVTVITEEGKIDGRADGGFKVVAGGKDYTASKLLIATGSSAVVPPIPGVKENLGDFVLTNREVLELPEVPQNFAIIGGGVIGLEIASYYNSVGADVTVVEMLTKIAGPTNGDISALLQKTYEKRGVKFLLGTKVCGVEEDKPGHGYVLCEKDGKTDKVEADMILVSTGRRPRTKGIGLETLGVLMDRASVITDDCGRTSVPGLWAAGDVNGKIMLAHTAYREGEVAVNNMLGKKDRVDYRSIPSVIYTNPEVASVGESVESAAKAGIKASAHTVSLRYSGRYIAENEGGDGFVKLVIDDEHRTLLGVHMIGTYASEIIYGAAAMVAREMRVEDVQKLVFPHPSVCEVLREGMFMI